MQTTDSQRPNPPTLLELHTHEGGRIWWDGRLEAFGEVYASDSSGWMGTPIGPEMGPGCPDIYTVEQCAQPIRSELERQGYVIVPVPATMPLDVRRQVECPV